MAAWLLPSNVMGLVCECLPGDAILAILALYEHDATLVHKSQLLFRQRLLNQLAECCPAVDAHQLARALVESQGVMSGSFVLRAILLDTEANDIDLLVPKASDSAREPRSRRDEFCAVENLLWETMLRVVVPNCAACQQMRVRFRAPVDVCCDDHFRYDTYSDLAAGGDSGISMIRTYTIGSTKFQVIRTRMPAREFVATRFDFDCVKNVFDGRWVHVGHPTAVMNRTLDHDHSYATPIHEAYRMAKYVRRGFSVPRRLSRKRPRSAEDQGVCGCLSEAKKNENPEPISADKRCTLNDESPLSTDPTASEWHSPVHVRPDWREPLTYAWDQLRKLRDWGIVARCDSYVRIDWPKMDPRRAIEHYLFSGQPKLWEWFWK